MDRDCTGGEEMRGAAMAMRTEAVPGPTLADIKEWAGDLHALVAQIGPRFARAEARRRVAAYLTGLLSPVARKNGWQLAEQAGDRTPYAMQHLLGRAQWDADAVRDDLSAYVRAHLADPEAALVVDETAILKKGTHSVGVGRPYCGMTGQLENCQVGVFLLYASPHGQTFLDRALYLPEDWTADPTRLQQAAVPADVDFATKPTLAWRLIERALDTGVPVRWVLGDEVYGRDGRIRYALDERRQPYIFTVDTNTAASIGWEQVRVGPLMETLPPEAWQRLSAGNGTKGPRLYDWARVRINSLGEPAWARWFVARRSVGATADEEPRVDYFMVGAPEETTLAEIAHGAGLRWTIETGFKTAKGEVGLDHYEVRSWHGWYRHITLAMFAHAYLTVMRARGNATEAQKRGLRPSTPSIPRAFKRNHAHSCP